MTRQAGMQPGATSSKAGKFQGAKPLPDASRAPSFHWPERLDPSHLLFWDSRGALFLDEACTKPTRLYVLELDRGSPRPEEFD
jgi:hypothetical protein